MRPTTKAFLIGLVAITGLLLSTNCAGIKVRESALIPAMQTAWPAVSASVSRASQTAATAKLLKAMTDALDAQDRFAAKAVNWPLLKSFAMIGISIRLKAKEIGPGVAESLRERVRVFDLSYRKLIAR